MSYEYFFHTPRYKPFDKGLIEERVRLLPYVFECHAKDGSRFYTVTGDEETKNLVHKMIESGNTFAVPDFADEVTIVCDEVVVGRCASVNEAFRSFCNWLVHEFGCSIRDEFDDPSSLEEMFPPLAQR
jgi:hypothetical protein